MEHNPYAAPASSIAVNPEDLSLQEGMSEEDRDLQIFVRRNASYYLRKWGSISSEVSSGFNWVAFLFSGIWLPYRKMYRITLQFYGSSSLHRPSRHGLHE